MNILQNGNFSQIQGPKKSRPAVGASGDVFNPYGYYWKALPGKNKVPWDLKNDSGWQPPEWQIAGAYPPFVDESGLIPQPANSNIVFTDWQPTIYPPGTKKKERGVMRPWRLMDKFSQGVFSAGKVYQAGLYQNITVNAGWTIKVSGLAHSWANINLPQVPDVKHQPPDVVHSGDSNWTTGIGDIAYRALAPENWPNIPSTGDLIEDAKTCIAHRVGIDPTGGVDYRSDKIVWGKWTILYNKFDAIEPVEAIAQAGNVTCFFESLCRWGFSSNNTYWARLSAEMIEATPEPVPEVNYVVVANLLPQDATKVEKLFVVDDTHDRKETILQSADDAKRLVKPGLPGSHVVVWAAERWLPIDITAYLGVACEMRELPKV